MPNLSFHCIKRLEERNISKNDIRIGIEYGKEYLNDNKIIYWINYKALQDAKNYSDTNIEKYYGLYMVVDVINNVLITVYYKI